MSDIYEIEWPERVQEEAEMAEYYTEKAEYEERIIRVACECCNADAAGTRRSLYAMGWTFAPGEEFCPEHRY